MGGIIVSMISSSSLSAFSASATNGIVTGPRPIQQAQATGPATRAQSVAPPMKLDLSRPPPQGGQGQSMPRGSLLDLSV